MLFSEKVNDTLNLDPLKIEIMSVYTLIFKWYIKEDTLDSMVGALHFFPNL